MNLTTLSNHSMLRTPELNAVRLWSAQDYNIGIVYTEEIIHDNGVKELVTMYLSDSLSAPISTVVDDTWRGMVQGVLK